VDFDAIFRYVAKLSSEDVPAYDELDLRLAWSPRPGFELAVGGQNLLHAQHAEFGAISGREYVQRAVYGNISWHF
jgi:iron complex outermembrane receptor protein